MASIRAQVYNNLSIMLEAGVPVRRSLPTAVSPARGELAKAWGDVAEAVRAGDSLAEAMKRHPKEFAELDVLVIEAGEVSGGLPEATKRLSQWYEFCERIKKTVVSAMVLPVLVLIGAAMIIPFPAWFRRDISSWGYLWQMLLPLAVLFVPIAAIWAIVQYTPKAGAPRRFVDGTALKIPLLGRAAKQLALSRFFSAFHTLFKAGVQIDRCVDMSAEVTGNALVREWILPGAQSAREGHPVSEGFGPEFPKDFLDAWLVGEESGKLEEVTEQLAKIATDKAEWMMGEIANWLPKLIYALICIWMVKNIFEMWGAVGQRIGLGF